MLINKKKTRKQVKPDRIRPRRVGSGVEEEAIGWYSEECSGGRQWVCGCTVRRADLKKKASKRCQGGGDWLSQCVVMNKQSEGLRLR